jgi:hypothetical protein
MSEGRDLVMSECSEPMSSSRGLSVLMRFVRGLRSLARKFGCSQVILFAVLFANAMCMGRRVVQFLGPPAVLRLESLLVTS